jgi:hypothetical protein
MKIIFLFFLLILTSCGTKLNQLFSDRSSFSKTCTLQLDDSSWKTFATKNPSENLISVTASTEYCKEILSSNSDIQFEFDLRSNAFNFDGEQLSLEKISVGSRNLLFNNVNFQFGKVQGILVDSRINTQFKPPFFDPGYIVITFKIPYYLNSSYFPKGLIFLN